MPANAPPRPRNLCSSQVQYTVWFQRSMASLFRCGSSCLALLPLTLGGTNQVIKSQVWTLVERRYHSGKRSLAGALPVRSRGQGQGTWRSGMLVHVRQCAGNAGNTKTGVPCPHRICRCRLHALTCSRVRAVCVAAVCSESGSTNFTRVLQVGPRSSPA